MEKKRNKSKIHIDINFFLSPYKDFVKKEEELEKERKRKEEARKPKPKAYLITTKMIPEFYFLTFITYEEAKEKADTLPNKKLSHGFEKVALARCSEYLVESIGLRDTSNGIYFSLKRKRAYNIDRFYEERTAPLYEYLELGLKFRCKCCGKGKLGLDEYKKKECFIVEGEGEYNPFTRGIMFCKKCYDKYFYSEK